MYGKVQMKDIAGEWVDESEWVSVEEAGRIFDDRSANYHYEFRILYKNQAQLDIAGLRELSERVKKEEGFKDFSPSLDKQILNWLENGSTSYRIGYRKDVSGGKGQMFQHLICVDDGL